MCGEGGIYYAGGGRSSWKSGEFAAFCSVAAAPPREVNLAIAMTTCER